MYNILSNDYKWKKTQYFHYNAVVPNKSNISLQHTAVRLPLFLVQF